MLHPRTTLFWLTVLALAGPSPGPAADTGFWRSLGPEGGSVFSLAIDPSAPATLYMGAEGGFFKSTDGGATWGRRSPGLTSPELDITHIPPQILLVDPHRPSTLYAGVNGQLSFSDGVFRSTDRGETWSGIGLFEDRVESLAVAPPPAAALYAGTTRGVFKSTDGGRSWTPVNSGLMPASGTGLLLVTALAVDPAVPRTLYAGTEPFALYKSTDGGATWVDVGSTLPSQGRDRVNAIAIDPRRPADVYALSNNRGIFRSRDGGATWTKILRTQSVLTTLRIHPRDGTIYAVGGEVLISPDGVDWRSANGVRALFTRPMQLRALALDPRDSVVALVGDSQANGVAATRDGGRSWELRNRGFHGTTIEALAAHGARIYAATFQGVWRSLDRGRTWRLVNDGLDAPAVALEVDPRDPEVVYAGTFFGVYKTRNGGRSWQPTAGTGQSLIRDLAIAPDDPSVIYAGAQAFGGLGGVFKSSDGGETWERFVAGLDDLDVAVLAAVDAVTVYAGTVGGGGIFKTTDGGATWTPKGRGLPLDEERFAVTALAVDPARPETLYVGTSRFGIGKTVDGGELWFPVNSGLTDPNVEALVVDPGDSETVYAGTFFHGVFRTTDGGGLWEPFNSDLEPRSVSALVLDDLGQPLAGTRGGGIAVVEPCMTVRRMCLNRGRFKVEVDWKDFRGGSGPGRVVPEPSDDSGLFWFFAPDNWEMLVKVLDGCAHNGRFWVFAAATTNVEYTLRVTDTETGLAKEYHNPLGRAAPALTDTDAFDVCSP